MRLVLGRDSVAYCMADVERAHDLPRNEQGMGFILGQVVRHARGATVKIGTTECFGRDHFSGGCFDQGGTAKENRALVLDNHRLVGHGRHIGTASGTGAHDNGNLTQVQEKRMRCLMIVLVCMCLVPEEWPWRTCLPD